MVLAVLDDILSAMYENRNTNARGAKIATHLNGVPQIAAPISGVRPMYALTTALINNAIPI
jgi:hypothetical protein